LTRRGVEAFPGNARLVHDRDLLAVDEGNDLLPRDGLVGGERFWRGQPISFEPPATHPLVRTWQVVECCNERHGPGERHVRFERPNDRSATILRIPDHLDATIHGKPAREDREELDGKLRPLPVAVRRAALLRPIEAEEQRKGDPTIGIPRKRNPESKDYPAVPESERDLAFHRRPVPIARARSVVMHPRAEDVRTIASAERVVDEGQDLVRKEWQKQPEKCVPERVGDPPCSREEPIECGVVLLPRRTFPSLAAEGGAKPPCK
jgi:hypothetical protein